MNFIFMILFVLIILLLLCNYIKTLNKKVLALFILVLFIINELYFYFEKDKKDKNKEHYTGLDGESLPTLFSVSGLNPLANFPFTKSELEKSIKEENYISNNFDCEDHTIEGDCDADYGCIFNINKCQSKDDYCNKITDYTLCNDDAATNICIYKGDTCISQDRYCENLTSKQECSRANECEFNDSHQKCFSKKSKLSNGGVIQDHDTSGFDCHIYGSEEKCSQKQRILDKCTDDDPLPKCDNLDKTECGKKKGNGCNYNDTNQKCESNKYKICKNKYCIYDPNTQKKASSQTTQSLRDKFKCSVEDAFSMFKPTGAKTTGTGTGSGTCSPYTVFLKDFNKDNTVDSNGEPIPIPIPESNFVKAFNIENNKEIEQQRKLFKFSTSINPNKNNGTIMELLPTKKIYSLQSLNDDDKNKTTKFTDEIHSYTYKIKDYGVDDTTRNITNYKFQSYNIADVHFIPGIITIDKGLSIMCYLNRTKSAKDRFIKMGFIMYDTIKDFSHVNNSIIIGKCFLLTESMSKNIIENTSEISNKEDNFYRTYDNSKENNIKDFLVGDGQYKEYIKQNIRQKKDTGFLVFSIEVELQQNISQCAWLQNNLINKIGCDDINLKYKDDTAELKKRCMLNNCKYNTNESKCENSYGCYKKCYNYNYDDLIHKKDNSELPKTDYKKLKNTCKSECLLETSKYYEIGNNRVDLDEPKNNYYNQQYCSFDVNDNKCKANCVSGNSVEDMVFDNII